MRRPPLSLAEIELLERTATPREHLLLRLLYETGCTLSELLTIRRRDLHGTPEQPVLTIQHRRVPITPHLRRLINHALAAQHRTTAHRQRRAHNPYLLQSRESQRLTPRRAEQLLASLGRRALGTPVTPSQLRATRIIHDFLNKVPINEIERKVGLRSIQPYLYAYFKQEGWSS